MTQAGLAKGAVAAIWLNAGADRAFCDLPVGRIPQRHRDDSVGEGLEVDVTLVDTRITNVVLEARGRLPAEQRNPRKGLAGCVVEVGAPITTRDRKPLQSIDERIGASAGDADLRCLVGLVNVDDVVASTLCAGRAVEVGAIGQPDTPPSFGLEDHRSNASWDPLRWEPAGHAGLFKATSASA